MYIAAISAAPSTVTTTQLQALEQVVEVRDEDAMAVDEQPTAAAQLTPKTIQCGLVASRASTGARRRCGGDSRVQEAAYVVQGSGV
jgi:hypothetical protein